MIAAELPPIQEVGPGGTLRWAVGHPDGPRSGTWNVTVAANSSDVYIGARETLGAVKLTLHPLMWRLAHLERYAQAHLELGVDRLIQRWKPAPESVPGWRPALFVLIASSLLGPAKTERAPKYGTIAWWPDPGDGGLVSFKLLLGAPDGPPLLAGGGVHPVAVATLHDRQRLYVAAEYGPSGPELEHVVRNRRTLVEQGSADGGPWAWSTTSSGVPSLLDTAALHPDGRNG